MQIKKNKTQAELEITVELSVEEMKPHVGKACELISKDMKVEGFRPGHVPYNVLKNQVGEITILQEAANIAVNKTVGEVMKNNIAEKGDKPIGQPQVRITKVAAGNPVEYKINISLMPEVKLGKYKGLNVGTHSNASVPEEKVEKVIKDLQNMRAKEKIKAPLDGSDAIIKDGDKVLIDIDMFLDKVPLEGGQGKGTVVLVGDDYIIPGFGKQLLGAKKGEKREFKLPYPKDHFQKNLAGKMVEFTVAVKEIYERELPEANDEFAKSLGAKDAKDLKNNIKKNLEAEEKQKAEEKIILAILNKLIESTSFSHIPETIVATESHNIVHELKHNVEQQGGKFEDYLIHIKKTAEELEKELKPEAQKRVKTSLIISEIARSENIKIEEKELDEAVEKQLAVYKNKPEIRKKADNSDLRDHLYYNMMNRKVIDRLKEWNITKNNN